MSLKSRTRHSHPITLLLLVLVLLAAATDRIYAQDSTLASQYRIKYRSVDRIYLEGGKADGLWPGDRLGIPSGEGYSVILEVSYASDHSASCKIVGGDTDFQAGQFVTVITRVVRPSVTSTADSTAAPVVSQPNIAPQSASTRRNSANTSRTYGSAALQWMNQHDRTGSGANFSQSTLRLNLRATNLWSQPFTFVVRTRGQYEDRNRANSSGAPNNDWDNRIYEFSLAYGSPISPVTLQVGRILPRHLTRVGYVDGAAVDFALHSYWHVGATGGLKPRWQYSSEDVSLQKYGAYFGYENHSREQIRFDQYLAFAGEYHGGDISRELLDIQGSLQLQNGIWFNNQFEIDINRGWRRDKSDAGFEISSVYLSARWRLSKQVTFGSTYDTRKNYWTYTQQSIADSLFDDQLRRGARADLYLNLPHQFNFNSQVGYRKAANDADPTISYVFYASKAGLPAHQSRITLRYSNFNGPTNDGYNYSLRFAQRFGEILSLEAARGLYRYELAGNNDSRSNSWWEGVARLEAIRSWYFDALYQNESGADLNGYTLRLEIGRRF